MVETRNYKLCILELFDQFEDEIAPIADKDEQIQPRALADRGCSYEIANSN